MQINQCNAAIQILAFKSTNNYLLWHWLNSCAVSTATALRMDPSWVKHSPWKWCPHSFQVAILRKMNIITAALAHRWAHPVQEHKTDREMAAPSCAMLHAGSVCCESLQHSTPLIKRYLEDACLIDIGENFPPLISLHCSTVLEAAAACATAVATSR